VTRVRLHNVRLCKEFLKTFKIYDSCQVVWDIAYDSLLSKQAKIQRLASTLSVSERIAEKILQFSFLRGDFATVKKWMYENVASERAIILIDHLDQLVNLLGNLHAQLLTIRKIAEGSGSQ
jgi:hypothetical protein